MANQVVLTGFKEFQDKLKNLPKTVQSEVNRNVQDAAEMWEEFAVADAPSDQGLLRQSIAAVKVEDGIWDVVSPQEYSAYVEWGTRTKVNVPADLQSYAQQFKGSGSGGGNAREIIYAWCKRKGIPEEAWGAVFNAIMIKGITPHPFFFIQRPRVEAFLIQNIKEITNAEY